MQVELSNLTTLAFLVGLLAAIGVLATLVVTLTTDRRLWPPGEKSLAYYVHWTLANVFNGSIVVVAYRDWNAWTLPRPATFVVGLVLAAFGAVVFVLGADVMRPDETMGVTGDLYTDGAYAYSRNPQYVGMLVGMTGFALVANSQLVAVLAAAHNAWVVLLPFAEEPHLRAEFGAEYERYLARVPRFVGGRTVRELLQNDSA